jgi:hypothetical protein
MGRSLGTIRELSDSNPEALVWPDPQRRIDGIDFPKIVVTKGLSELSSAQKNQFAFEPACLLARFLGPSASTAHPYNRDEGARTE